MNPVDTNPSAVAIQDKIERAIEALVQDESPLKLAMAMGMVHCLWLIVPPESTEIRTHFEEGFSQLAAALANYRTDEIKSLLSITEFTKSMSAEEKDG